MNKSELLDWLREEYQHREAFLTQIGPARMDQPVPAGEFFYHFHQDHEPDMRAWLARAEQQQ